MPVGAPVLAAVSRLRLGATGGRELDAGCKEFAPRCDAPRGGALGGQFRRRAAVRAGRGGGAARGRLRQRAARSRSPSGSAGGSRGGRGHQGAVQIDGRAALRDLGERGGGGRRAARRSRRDGGYRRPPDRLRPASKRAAGRRRRRPVAAIHEDRGLAAGGPPGADLRPPHPRGDAGQGNRRPGLQRHPHPCPAAERTRRELAVLGWPRLRARQHAHGDLPQLSAGRDGAAVPGLRALLQGDGAGVRRRRRRRLHAHLVGRPDPPDARHDRDPRSGHAVRPAADRRARRPRPLSHARRGGARPDRHPGPRGPRRVELPGHPARPRRRSPRSAGAPASRPASLRGRRWRRRER